MKKLTNIPENYDVQICISEFKLIEDRFFYFAIVPTKLKGHQWHRDIFPAMRRFITLRVFGTKRRPVPKNKPIDYKFNKRRLISLLDALDEEAIPNCINSTKNGKKYLWAIYDPEKREMEEVTFI